MVIEPISDLHNRLAFSCGNDKLDRYLQENARQAKRKGLAVTFVATDPKADPSRILGYYSLSSFMIQGLDIPEVVRKVRGLPAHQVSATLLGRLAVAKTAQRRGIGTMLVADALKRAYMVSGDVASVAVVVDAIEKDAVAFYEAFGFMPTEKDDLRLVLMMDTIAKLLPGVPNTTAAPQQTTFWSA
jgi:ribosomal protein S18 acetylase RimI-like enzyme